ncbi:pseudouridine synthase [Geomesophilobacter sediminis]
MQERLQKILSQAGISSRREAEGIILDGRVAVNGMVVTELGTKADPDNDMITVDGKAVTIAEHRVYILLYKPVGYMTTLKDPEGRPIVTDLLKNKVRERIYPVGRLDYNTEGLLLLTNDGDFANAMMHPSHEVDKGYLVRVSGKVSDQQIQQLTDGVELDDGKTAPAKVFPVKESENNSWISITIHEGRYRQVRRMCEAVGLSVVRLKRSRYDFLEIGELKPGEFRYLSPAEVLRLKRQTPPPAPVQKRPFADREGAKAKPSRPSVAKGGTRPDSRGERTSKAKTFGKGEAPVRQGGHPRQAERFEPSEPSEQRAAEAPRSGKRYLVGERDKAPASGRQERRTEGKAPFAAGPAARPQRPATGHDQGPGSGPRGTGAPGSGYGQKKKPPRSK